MMTLSKRVTVLEVKLKLLEKAIYALVAINLADLGFTII